MWTMPTNIRLDEAVIIGGTGLHSEIWRQKSRSRFTEISEKLGSKVRDLDPRRAEQQDGRRPKK